MLGALLMPWTFLALSNFQSRQGMESGIIPTVQSATGPKVLSQEGPAVW